MDQDVPHTEDEWRARLSPEQFKVLRRRGTEPPFSGAYVHEKTPGMYTCAACGQALFSSQTKYDSGSGWPSFYDVISAGAVRLQPDTSQGLERTEVVCARCGSHLGHVFDDGPTQTPDGQKATGQRYCINSLALQLKPDQSKS